MSVIAALPVEERGHQVAKLVHVGQRLVREAAVGIVEALVDRLMQSFGFET